MGVQSSARTPTMNGRHTTRIPALAATLAAGVLAAYALRGGSPSTPATAQQPAAEVRTQVIRRTIHVVRHEKPPRSTAGSSSHSATAQGRGGAPAATRTATSGAHGTSSPNTVSGSAPRTRTSPASGTPAGSAPASSPVRTHTSGSTGSGRTTTGGSSGSPRTRTSGGHATTPTGAVRTRTSGGGEHGDGGGGHDD